MQSHTASALGRGSKAATKRKNRLGDHRHVGSGPLTWTVRTQAVHQIQVQQQQPSRFECVETAANGPTSFMPSKKPNHSLARGTTVHSSSNRNST